MEQANYWMWMRRKLTEKSHQVQASAKTSYNDSWEEQAFAEDSAGPLGGCIWPPRSYTCSFCRREFRSAQALGGHMNVHRRDRARLKQSPNPHNETTLQHQNPSTSLGVHQYTSQVCSLDFSPNSNLTASRVSIPSTLEKCNLDKTLVLSPPYSSTMVQNHQIGSLLSAQDTHIDSIAVKVISLSDSNLEGEMKRLRAQEIRLGVCGANYHRKTDSDVSLNLIASRTRKTRSGGDDDEVISNKRRKMDATSLPFFLKPKSVDRQYHIQSEVFGLNCSSSMEEIDLELRLGDRPKVK